MLTLAQVGLDYDAAPPLDAVIDVQARVKYARANKFLWRVAPASRLETRGEGQDLGSF